MIPTNILDLEKLRLTMDSYEWSCLLTQYSLGEEYDFPSSPDDFLYWEELEVAQNERKVHNNKTSNKQGK